MDEYGVDPPKESSVGLGCQVNYGYMVDTFILLHSLWRL